MGTPPGHLLEVPLDKMQIPFLPTETSQSDKGGKFVYGSGLKCGWNALHCVSKLPCNVVAMPLIVSSCVSNSLDKSFWRFRTPAIPVQQL
jgi:hypothetical protein